MIIRCNHEAGETICVDCMRINAMHEEIATLRAKVAELEMDRERMEALVEKRERQIVWCLRHDACTQDALPMQANGIRSPFGIAFTPDDPKPFEEEMLMPCENTDAGLLAAVDEVCP